MSAKVLRWEVFSGVVKRITYATGLEPQSMGRELKTDEGLNKAIQDLVRSWNAAEQSIKMAESIRGEIVLPAIFELRYAGRRTIDCLNEIIQEEPDFDRARSSLSDAKLDTIRAKHDAIDAVTVFVTAQLNNVVKSNPPELVRERIRNFNSLVDELFTTRKKIAASRGDRTSRDRIYTEIGEGHFDKVVELGNAIYTSGLSLSDRKPEKLKPKSLQAPLAISLGILSAVIGALLVFLT